MKRAKRLIIIAVVVVILICLPVIPISTAPVVPSPIYSTSMVAIVQILFSPLTVGTSYQWQWYTFAVTLILLAVGRQVGVSLLRKIEEPSGD